MQKRECAAIKRRKLLFRHVRQENRSAFEAEFARDATQGVRPGRAAADHDQRVVLLRSEGSGERAERGRMVFVGRGLAHDEDVAAIGQPTVLQWPKSIRSDRNTAATPGEATTVLRSNEGSYAAIAERVALLTVTIAFDRRSARRIPCW